MRRRPALLILLLAGACSAPERKGPLPPSQPTLSTLSGADRAAAEKTGLSATEAARLISTPLYRFTPKDLDRYLAFLQAREPSLRKRVTTLARKALGQPYKIYLLGEFPFEILDPDPLFSLSASDCVTFVEHMYAMALSGNWRTFFVTLQRIRYMGGEIGLTTRNHFTIPDWEPSNAWLVRPIDLPTSPGGKRALLVRTGRRSFFKKWGLGKDFPEKSVKTTYYTPQGVREILPYLKEGDMVQVIRTFGGKEGWCGHVGLVGTAPGGTVTFINSTRPRVKEEPILDYMNRNLRLNPGRKAKKRPFFLGFRFLRLQPNPLENLREIDGPDAPVLRIPARRGRPR